MTRHETREHLRRGWAILRLRHHHRRLPLTRPHEMGRGTAEGITEQRQWRDNEPYHTSRNAVLEVLCSEAQIVFNATNAQHYRRGSALKLLQDRPKVSCPSRIGIGVNGLEQLLLAILCGANGNVLRESPSRRVDNGDMAGRGSCVPHKINHTMEIRTGGRQNPYYPGKAACVDSFGSTTMIPQHTLQALGNLGGSEGQTTRVRAEQDIDLILSDKTLSQRGTFLRFTRVVIGCQA